MCGPVYLDPVYYNAGIEKTLIVSVAPSVVLFCFFLKGRTSD